MLLRVGVGQDAVVDLGPEARSMPPPAAIRRLRERGLLVATQAHAAELLRALRGCASPELAAALGLLLQSRCQDAPAGPVDLDALQSVNDLLSWQGVVDVVMLDGDTADLLREEGQDPDVTSFLGLMNSTAVERNDELWQRACRTGEKREDVWRDRFELFARHSERVYLIDRYAALQLDRDVAKGSSARVPCGARWFLTRLARSRIREIHLVSSARELGTRVDQASDAIRSWWNSLSTGKELDLVLAGGNFNHGRYLAFDGWVGMTLHNGLASFDGTKLEEPVPLQPNPDTAQLTKEMYEDYRSGRLGSGEGAGG